MPSISVLTVLANIPWGQVVEHAPKLAQGATRLWESVKGRREAPAAGAGEPAADELPADPAQLQQQVRALQAQVQGLQEQMQATAEVVKQLAEQNALMVQRMEATRQKLGRLAAAGGVAVAGLAAALAYLLASAFG